MSKFFIECPACHRYSQASTSLFASRRIRCACGFTIDVKADRITTRVCPSCGNSIAFDQAKGATAKCPICRAQLLTPESMNSLVTFACRTCGCTLQANKGAQQITCPLCDTVNDVQAEVKLAAQRAQGTPQVIRYEGDNMTFVWRHPATDFVMGSQLIVHESQEALFFRNGEALDSFPAGRYTLEDDTLPRNIRPAQGQTFHAEVYFVNLTTQMGIKWGTNSKVGLFDPASGLHVELGASGSFNLRVTDPRRLVIQLVGTSDQLTQAQIFVTWGVHALRQLFTLGVKYAVQIVNNALTCNFGHERKIFVKRFTLKFGIGRRIFLIDIVQIAYVLFVYFHESFTCCDCSALPCIKRLCLVGAA